MTPEIMFILGTLIFTVAVAVFILISRGNKQSKKSRLLDIGKAVGIVILIAVVAAITNAVVSDGAKASDDLVIFDKGTIHAGLQYPMTRETNICTPGENQIASDLSAGINVLTYRDTIGFGGAYTHNSCAAGSDEDVYDAMGAFMFIKPVERVRAQAGIDWNAGNSVVCTDSGEMFNGRVDVELYRYDRFSAGAGYTIHKCIGGDGTEYQGAGLFLRLDLWNRGG